jgi:membrane-associated phospholipid phosphatase
MLPWVLDVPSEFRPAGPHALGSLPYLADLDETRTMGNISSAQRTADETFAAQFWASTTANYFWDGVAMRLSAARHMTLSENARLLALVNVAMADAAIACWDAKYHYVFWRPITAIRASTDPAWTPLIPTPAHPEYPSGHSTVSGAAAAVLAAVFGDNVAFVIDTDGANQSSAGPGAPPLAGATRTFTSFTAALEEVKNARIFGGIHFRTACDDGQATGKSVAEFVLAHAFHPLNGNGTGQAGK